MSFTDGLSPEPSQPAPATTTYSTPSQSDLAAVAATVSVVGVLMALLIAWLIVHLRRAGESQSQSIPIVSRRPTSTASYAVRPSFAPSEASSKFGFIRKPLRLSHRHKGGSWDFADPDPFPHQGTLVHTPSQKHRPAPLSPIATTSIKDEWAPCTPTMPGTPASMDYVEPPPPAYCRDSPWLVQHPNVRSPS